MNFRSLWTCFAAAICTLAVTAAQDPRPQQPQPPAFRSEINFVRVDVFATRKGVPAKDLTRDDFQVFEDGAAQTISTFEQVEVRAGIPQEERAEPNTIQQSRDAMKNPRARVFVLYLDVPHVTIAGAWTVREPLIRLIERLMGPEDLMGIMTTRMAASDIVFARKTRVIEEGLRDRWPWGERHTLQKDEREQLYEACYPWPETKDVVAEMIARKRERETLESLQELVGWLRDQREERKAVLTFTEGWLLFRRNADLTRLRKFQDGRTEPIPGPEAMGVGADGRLRVGGRDNVNAPTTAMCHADRVRLADIDDDMFMRDLIADANRANATFYTVDPRGLAAWDAPMGPAPPPPPHIDQARLRSRLDSLHVLANNTDGFAVVNSNDLDKGLRRISDDLTTYYLLGYYSTNTKLDGRFRSIKVNVQRPGIDVRARRGYKAPTEAEVNAARRAAATPVPESVSIARDAMAGLGRIRPAAPFYAHAVALKSAATTVWVAGELSQPAAAPSTAVLTVSTVGATNTAEVTIAAGQRGFVASVPLKIAATAPIDVRVRVSTGESLPLTDAVRVDAASAVSNPLMFRRGPATGNRLEPAGVPQFSRTDRARFEVALDGTATVTGAGVLDRNATATTIPVTLAERTDASGQRWGTVDIVLAALAPGDYLLELTGTSGGDSRKFLTAFRVTR